MEAKSIAALLRAKPFKPFSLRSTRTGVYEVSSPAGALLTKTKLYLPKDVDCDGIADDVAQIPLAQISSVGPA